MVKDNYYTRHTLAWQPLSLVDNETRMLGAFRINNIDTPNITSILEAIEKLQNAPSGESILLQA